MARTKKKTDLEPPKIFGERVKAIRTCLKLTQKEMAPVVGISATHFSEIEKDKAKPCHDFFFNIIKNYHVNPYYLFFGEGEMFGDSGSDAVIDGKKIKTGDKNIDTFLYYFFNSEMVKSYTMFKFWKLYEEEKSNIMKNLGKTLPLLPE